jgi:hypothetical protein
MDRLSKDALLGASDLVERDVDLPSIGGSVKVRSLSAAYSNEASSEALELKTDPRGNQIATVNTAKLEALQALHGLVEPKLSSLVEAEQFAKNCGPAFKKVIDVIDEISGVDKEAIEKANATFPVGGEGQANGREAGAEAPAGVGSGGPDQPARAGA